MNARGKTRLPQERDAEATVVEPPSMGDARPTGQGMADALGDCDRWRRLHVLLVDDSGERRASIESSLSEVGCNVVGFVSSREDVLTRV